MVLERFGEPPEAPHERRGKVFERRYARPRDSQARCRSCPTPPDRPAQLELDWLDESA